MRLTDIEHFLEPEMTTVKIDPNQLESYENQITFEHLMHGDQRRQQMNRKAYQEYIKKSWRESVGPMPENGLISARTMGRFALNHLYAEIIALETCPGFFMSCTLYKPKNANGKLPAVLFVCGHSKEGRLHRAYQRAATLIASAGMIVLSMDSIGQGGRIEYTVEGLQEPALESPWQQHDYVGAQCLLTGITPGSIFVHDAMCAREYLDLREDVESDQVGLTGCSGGGTLVSMLMMHAPEKFQASAPCCFLSSRKAILMTRRRQDAEQIWPGMVAAGLDHADVLIAFAPKPVHLLAADADFFPIEGLLESMEKARPFWKTEGKEDLLEISIDRNTHSYSEEMARNASAFFSRVLLQRQCDASVLCEEILPEEAEKSLESVFDQLHSKTVHDLVVERLEVLQKPDINRAKAYIIPQMKPRTEYPLFVKRRSTQDQLLDLRAEAVLWFQEPGLHNFGLWLTPADGNVTRVVLGLWDGGTQQWPLHVEEMLEICHTGGGLLIIDLAGTGAMSDGLYAPESSIYWWSRMVVFDDTLLVNGDNVVALRSRGVVRAREVAVQLAGEVPVDVLAYGRFALYAHVAKFSGCLLSTIEEKLPVESFQKLVREKYYDYHDIRSFIMPGMLEHFDLNDLRRWNAHS